MIERMARTALRRFGELCAMATVVTGLSFSFAPAAHAASAAWMAEADDNAELLDGGAPPPGRTTWGSSVLLAGAGTLTVQAYDLGVPMTLMDRLESLSFSVSNSTSMLGSHVGDGSMTFDLTGPGEYFVNFAAVVKKTGFGLPLVSWSISFTPTASQVPLPASVWLLIAGLAWATGMQRKRAKIALPAIFRNQSVTYAT
jgi:hypothetical protein